MTLDIYTDGGCSGNPGPGGWAYVIIQKTGQSESICREEWGGEKNTTNNRMELIAVISALQYLKAQKSLGLGGNSQQGQSLCITVHTDSQYVQKGITEWIRNWKRNSWRTKDKKPVKNKDLWLELDMLAGEFSVKWEWIQGHAGNTYNEHCDSLVQKAITSL